jgi:predicted  nucleic acid-binding Zn-ribbon protein
MGPILRGLIKLQRVENRLRAVQSKLARCRRTVLYQENQLRALQSGYEAKQQEIKLTRIQADRLELELKSRDEHLAKLRAALNMARTNKEYSAVLSELNTSKADDSKLESQVLELMKNIETDQLQCQGVQKQIDEHKAQMEQARTEAESKALELEKEISVIQKEWDLYAQKIPPESLSIFKRVAETYDGAMSQIEQQDINSTIFSCGGCFMGLPAEAVNVLSNKDEILRCPNCTRILYLKDGEE